MKLCFSIVFLTFSLMVAAQNSPNQDKKEIESNMRQDKTEFVKMNLGLLSQKPNDSIYHEGALLFVELSTDARSWRSNFCISCHDDVFIRAGHTTTNIGNPKNIDPSSIFSFNHPVAFEFTRSLALAKKYLNDPYTTPSGLGGTIADDLLVDGRIECVTCHNMFFKPVKSTKREVLNKSNVGSALCFTCHKR